MHRLTEVSWFRCGCLVKLDPRPRQDESVYCKTHGPTVVVDVVGQWVADCSGCPWVKGYGAARLTAEIGAAKHRQRVRVDKERHVVRLYDTEGRLNRTFGNRPDQDTLPVTET